LIFSSFLLFVSELPNLKPVFGTIVDVGGFIKVSALVELLVAKLKPDVLLLLLVLVLVVVAPNLNPDPSIDPPRLGTAAGLGLDPGFGSEQQGHCSLSGVFETMQVGQDQFFSFFEASWSLLISASFGLKNSVNGLGGGRVSILSFSPSTLFKDTVAFTSELVVEVAEPNEPKLDLALADPNAKSPADGFSSVEPLPFPKEELAESDLVPGVPKAKPVPDVAGDAKPKAEPLAGESVLVDDEPLVFLAKKSKAPVEPPPLLPLPNEDDVVELSDVDLNPPKPENKLGPSVCLVPLLTAFLITLPCNVFLSACLKVPASSGSSSSFQLS